MVEGGSLRMRMHGEPVHCQQRRAWSLLLGSVCAGRPNPSIERPSRQPLRGRQAAAHVERQASEERT